MPFDHDNPPIDPPPEADPTIWYIARQVVIDHRSDQHQHCITCRVPYPCNPHSIAEHALYLAAACRWTVFPVSHVVAQLND